MWLDSSASAMAWSGHPEGCRVRGLPLHRSLLSMFLARLWMIPVILAHLRLVPMVEMRRGNRFLQSLADEGRLASIRVEMDRAKGAVAGTDFHLVGGLPIPSLVSVEDSNQATKQDLGGICMSDDGGTVLGDKGVHNMSN